MARHDAIGGVPVGLFGAFVVKTVKKRLDERHGRTPR